MEAFIDMAAAALVLGVGATLLLDGWSWLLNKGFGVKSLSFCLVGRWFALMRHGQFRHNGIGKAPAQGWRMCAGLDRALCDWCVIRLTTAALAGRTVAGCANAGTGVNPRRRYCADAIFADAAGVWSGGCGG